MPVLMWMVKAIGPTIGVDRIILLEPVNRVTVVTAVMKVAVLTVAMSVLNLQVQQVIQRLIIPAMAVALSSCLPQI